MVQRESEYVPDGDVFGPWEKRSFEDIERRFTMSGAVGRFLSSEVITPKEFVRRLESGEIHHVDFDGPSELLNQLITDVHEGAI